MKKRKSHKLDTSMTAPDSDSARVDVSQYQKQIHSLKKKYKESEAKHKRQLKELNEQILELESNQGRGGGSNGGGGDSDNKLWAKIKASEKEKSELMAKYAALEAEY